MDALRKKTSFPGKGWRVSKTSSPRRNRTANIEAAAATPPDDEVDMLQDDECQICHIPIGDESPEGIVEGWSRLPCNHKFGSQCIKTWLGMAEAPACPICRSSMSHTCGHATVPAVIRSRPAMPTDRSMDSSMDSSMASNVDMIDALDITPSISRPGSSSAGHQGEKSSFSATVSRATRAFRPSFSASRPLNPTAASFMPRRLQGSGGSGPVSQANSPASSGRPSGTYSLHRPNSFPDYTAFDAPNHSASSGGAYFSRRSSAVPATSNPYSSQTAPRPPSSIAMEPRALLPRSSPPLRNAQSLMMPSTNYRDSLSNDFESLPDQSFPSQPGASGGFDPYADLSVAPTAALTAAPTAAPTVAPAVAPTMAPTVTAQDLGRTSGRRRIRVPSNRPGSFLNRLVHISTSRTRPGLALEPEPDLNLPCNYCRATLGSLSSGTASDLAIHIPDFTDWEMHLASMVSFIQSHGPDIGDNSALWEVWRQLNQHPHGLWWAKQDPPTAPPKLPRREYWQQ